MRPAAVLFALVTLAGLLVAGLFFFEPEEGPGYGTAQPRTPDGAAPVPETGDAELSFQTSPVASETESAPERSVEELEVPLLAEAEIQGRVIHAPAEILAGLEVHAALVEDPRLEVAAPVPEQHVPCGADGSFTLRGLLPGASYRLGCGPRGLGSFARARTAPLEARAGTRGVELRYLRESALLFQVVDARSATPLTAFEVRLGQRFLRPLLDDEGRVRRHFPEGRVRCADLIEPASGEPFDLVVAAHGYEELRRDDVFVPENGELEFGILRLQRAPRLEVRVLDEASLEPIAGALVTLTVAARVGSSPSAPEPALSGAFNPWQTRTDLDGRALLTSRPGEEATLNVRHKSHADLDRALFLTLLEEQRETVHMQPLERAPEREPRR